MLNRGNAAQTVFHKVEDYQAFLRVLGEALARYPVELFSFTRMPNHWHMVLRPSEDGLMGRMLRWVTATHTQRYHAHYQTAGAGHLYQSRYKSFPIADDDHFLIVCRYVERNPLRANLVERAEDYRRAHPALPRSLSDGRRRALVPVTLQELSDCRCRPLLDRVP